MRVLLATTFKVASPEFPVKLIDEVVTISPVIENFVAFCNAVAVPLALPVTDPTNVPVKLPVKVLAYIFLNGWLADPMSNNGTEDDDDGNITAPPLVPDPSVTTPPTVKFPDDVIFREVLIPAVGLIVNTVVGDGLVPSVTTSPPGVPEIPEVITPATLRADVGLMLPEPIPTYPEGSIWTNVLPFTLNSTLFVVLLEKNV